MKKNFGPHTYVLPMPVLILGTFDENNIPNAMNAAWGGTYDTNKIYVSLSEHKTTKNFNATGCFTVAFADASHVKESDYFGLASGNKENKVEKAGFHFHEGEFVHAPIFEEYPITLECKVESFEDGNLVGEIINVVADESILDEKGEISLEKAHIITYNPINHGYYEIGNRVGNAFKDGKELTK